MHADPAVFVRGNANFRVPDVRRARRLAPIAGAYLNFGPSAQNTRLLRVPAICGASKLMARKP